MTKASVKGLVRSKIIWKIGGGHYIRRKRLEDAAVGINRNGKAVVRRAQEPAAVFHGAHARDAKMLLGGGGASEPSVIRNVDEKLRPTGSKAAHFAGKDRFITDKNAEGIPARKLSHDVLVSFVEAAYLAGYAGDHAMDQGHRLVLAEGTAINLT